jgi:hypothetical protein
MFFPEPELIQAKTTVQSVPKAVVLPAVPQGVILTGASTFSWPAAAAARSALSASLACAAPRVASVYFLEPEPIQAGSPVRLLYNRSYRPLCFAGEVWVHAGYNSWKEGVSTVKQLKPDKKVEEKGDWYSVEREWRRLHECASYQCEFLGGFPLRMMQNANKKWLFARGAYCTSLPASTIVGRLCIPRP